MSKMGSHYSFGHMKHKLWPKERSEVKLPIWFPTTKSRESTRLTWFQGACDILLKSLWWELQLCFKSHFDLRSVRKGYGVPKSRESHLARFWDSHLGVPKKKSHLDVNSMASHKVYYKGEGGGFPQIWAMVNLLCSCCPWLILTPKVFQLCTNHFVWVVCRPVWMSEASQLFLVPSRSSNTPLYPSKCCELRSVPRFLPFPLFSTWTHIWVLQGVGSVSSLMMEILGGLIFFLS
jgi:hypothetical protein